MLTLNFSASPVSAQILPPPPAKLTMPARLFVHEFRFVGNKIFSQAELARVIAPFTNRAISNAELEDARRAVTVYYINHGYINSGAIIPDQDPAEGVVTMRIIEGVLSGIDLHENNWLRNSYITNRLQRWSGPPLNMGELQDGLQMLRQNPNVKQVNAELMPGTAPGQSILDLRVVDQQPFRAGLQIDNHRPPSVGAEEISMQVADLNLTGHSDPLNLTYGIANDGVNGGWGFSGWDNVSGDYAVPVNRFNTTFGVHASRNNSSIIENPFTSLNISSETTDFGVVLRQPLFQTPNREFALAVAFDRSQNYSTLLGEPFNVSPGAENGWMTVSVLGFSQEFVDRGQNHVFALRSTFNFGLDVLGATDNGVSGDPNGKFFAWLGQAQYVQRLFNTQNQLILRASGQWTHDSLLALEQISIGGSDTVRGYLENQLVRDSGLASSIEFRLPVLYDKSGKGIVQLAPFFDYGGAWNVGGSPSPTTIYSTGIGLLVTLNKYIDAQLYWGYRLRDVDLPDNNLQDQGITFQVNISAF
ncbi:MAG: ShlB/FhaC/HecB family hemolysin secretion/activation protein [Verrucomicrobiales bacterium]|nr:ShlB/FhaC/HecB family hemolysin secretion/activation protein [Verrucomicrobiales bacterium]